MKTSNPKTNPNTMVIATTRMVRGLAALSMALTMMAGLPANAQTNPFTAADYDEQGMLIVNIYARSKAGGNTLGGTGLEILTQLNDDKAPLKVISNVPISEAEICVFGGSGSNLQAPIVTGKVATIKTLTYFNTSTYRCDWTKFSTDVRTIDASNPDGRPAIITKLKLPFGSYNISNDFRPAAGGLASWYYIVSQRLNEFEGRIKKTDRRHLVRLKTALAEGIKGLREPDGKTFRPVTSDKVREQARLIMVLATVLNELLADYDDVPELQGSVNVLRNLSEQIRISYDWSTGGAGSGSKSFAPICEVIDMELRDLQMAMRSFGNYDPTAFNAIMRASWNIKRIVLASDGGDARAAREVEEFAKVWNSPAWQTVLGQLMNAPQDSLGLVQPKLKALLTYVESMSVLSKIPMDMNETIGQDGSQAGTSTQKPVAVRKK